LRGGEHGRGGCSGAADPERMAVVPDGGGTDLVGHSPVGVGWPQLCRRDAVEPIRSRPVAARPLSGLEVATHPGGWRLTLSPASAAGYARQSLAHVGLAYPLTSKDWPTTSSVSQILCFVEAPAVLREG